ncbi:MAG TPA: protein kinase [Candidatus Obscuribacterales bacterium]
MMGLVLGALAPAAWPEAGRTRMDLERTASRRGCVACGREFSAEVTCCPEDGTVLTPLVEQPAAGTVIGDRYEITGVIAEGGMGTIFRARHRLMKRTVAIKMLHPQMVSSASTLKRFQQEAEAASSLNHPNILTVFDFGISDQGKPYLVMDYLEGTSLAALLEAERRLPVERSLRIFVQACAALAHAHQKGIIHRDLKPANIMLVELDGHPDFVKLVDFGIAKLLEPEEGESAQLTKTGEVFGSPLYMSPEQCLGEAIDRRTDIYSLGCVMYRSLTGVAPADGRDVLELMYKHANVMPAGFADACPELALSEKLESVVFKALAKKPDDRYESMEALKAALESLEEYQPSGPIPTLAPRLTSEIPTSGASTTGAGTKHEITAPQIQGQQASTAKPQAVSPIACRDAGKDEQARSGLPEAPHWVRELGLTAAIEAAIALLSPLVADRRQRLLILGLITVLLASAVMAGLYAHLPWTQREPEPGLSGPITPAGKRPAQEGVEGRPAVRSVPASPLGASDGPAGEAATLPPGDRSAQAPDPSALFDRYMKAGQAAYASGDYRAARQNFQNAHEQAADFGQWDPRYAMSLEWVARAYASEGRFAEARSALDWVLQFRKTRFGARSPQVAQTLQDLSNVARQQGDVRAAQKFEEEAHSVRQHAHSRH